MQTYDINDFKVSVLDVLMSLVPGSLAWGKLSAPSEFLKASMPYSAWDQLESCVRMRALS